MLVAAGATLTCVEPDPAMADVLRARFAGRIDVCLGGFEQWPPPAGGVPLICSAQAFHWVDEATRWRRGFADRALEDKINIVYDQIAPELRDDPAAPQVLVPEDEWYHVDMAGSGLFE